MTANPSKDWREQVAGDEEKRFLGYAELLRDVQRRVDERKGKGRALHRKIHVGVEASFEILPGIPEPAAAGLFATPATYHAYVRFSNGGPFHAGDAVRDIRGIAIKVVGVPGKKIIPGMEDAKTQDFLLIHIPTFGFRNSDEFIAVVRARNGNPLLTLPRLIGKLGLRTFTVLPRILKIIGGPPSSLAHIRFFSAVPIRWGAYAGKLILRPLADKAPEGGPTPSDRNYLGADLGARLARDDIRFELAVQLYRDETVTPIEDGSVIWSETDAPPIPVARLTLPKQDTQSPRGRKLTEAIEQMSFDPWHALVEHRPLGDIMRARNVAYRLSTQQRGAAGEPDGSEKYD